MQTDTELISRIISGDLYAFRLLVRQHERLVSAMVGRIVQETTEAEDVCQNVFIRIHQKLHTFRGQSKLSTWIARIAYSTAINHVKSTAGRKALSEDLFEAESYFVADEDPEAALIKKDTAAYVQRMIAKLPRAYRTVLTLYHISELSCREIEEITGMPEGTVKNYLFRARKLLKDKLKHYDR